MMKKYISKIGLMLTICLLSTVLLSSCEKEGQQGPQGKDGAEGQQGVAGADGSTMLNGNGVPATTLGNNGDYYLDKTAVAIYGPKTANGWGNATSLKGDRGDAGKDGATMLSGAGTPSASLGAVGDFYFDTQNIAIYGPKSSAGWGTGVNLKASEANGVKVVVYKNHSFENIVAYNEYSSTIRTDAKYDDIYETGLVLAYLRKSGDDTKSWSDEVVLIGENAKSNGLTAYQNTTNIAKGEIAIMGYGQGITIYLNTTNIAKGEIAIMGYASGVSEDEVKAAKFDVKVVFIPASSVEMMVAKNVDTKNILAISKFLGL